MYLAAACRPDALCTWTTSVTKREAAPLPVCPSGLTGRCLYLMHTSNRPKKHNRSVTTFEILNMSVHYITITLCVCTRGLRLMSCRTVCPGNQGQGEHLSLVRMLSLHGDHGTQFRQWQHSFGHKLVSNIWIIISVETINPCMKVLLKLKSYQAVISHLGIAVHSYTK